MTPMLEPINLYDVPTFLGCPSISPGFFAGFDHGMAYSQVMRFIENHPGEYTLKLPSWSEWPEYLAFGLAKSNRLVCIYAMGHAVTSETWVEIYPEEKGFDEFVRLAKPNRSSETVLLAPRPIHGLAIQYLHVEKIDHQVAYLEREMAIVTLQAIAPATVPVEDIIPF